MGAVLITGSSWFIGFHVAKQLLSQGVTVVGLDNENEYYDIKLKLARRSILELYPHFCYYRSDIENLKDTELIFLNHKITSVLHLAAQAGVRYSIINPFAYIQTNIVGFHNIIELSRRFEVTSFVYASSASVYGGNDKLPFDVTDKTDTPLSLYWATKKADELIAQSYFHMHNFSSIGLRFFNVYGPYGRPDGAFWIFIKWVLEGRAIDIFNQGRSIRNFTYIDDIVDGILLALNFKTWFEIFNLGNIRGVTLDYMVACIEDSCWLIANKRYVDASLVDIAESGVDIWHTIQKLGWNPQTDIEVWITEMVDWYKKFHWIH